LTTVEFDYCRCVSRVVQQKGQIAAGNVSSLRRRIDGIRVSQVENSPGSSKRNRAADIHVAAADGRNLECATVDRQGGIISQ
jgi:hypothetical protein